MTKPITSMAVMMLYEEGKLKLDDAIQNFIPSFQGREVIDQFSPSDTTYTTKPLKEKITIRHF